MHELEAFILGVHFLLATGLPIRDETVKTTENSSNVTIQRSAFDIQILLLIFGKERNKFTVAGNCEYKETDLISSAQSSLKFHILFISCISLPIVVSDRISNRNSSLCILFYEVLCLNDLQLKMILDKAINSEAIFLF